MAELGASPGCSEFVLRAAVSSVFLPWLVRDSLWTSYSSHELMRLPGPLPVKLQKKKPFRPDVIRRSRPLSNQRRKFSAEVNVAGKVLSDLLLLHRTLLLPLVLLPLAIHRSSWRASDFLRTFSFHNAHKPLRHFCRGQMTPGIRRPILGMITEPIVRTPSSASFLHLPPRQLVQEQRAGSLRCEFSHPPPSRSKPATFAPTCSYHESSSARE